MTDRQPEPPSIRYAVAFSEGHTAASSGPLLIDEQTIHLQGRRNGEPIELSIGPGELARVRIGRRPGERLNGYQTLVLERHDSPPVLVAPFGIALLHELADLLTSLTSPPDQVAQTETLQLQVPLRPGRQQRVRQLVAEGPPFDPSQLGLRCHDVYLTEQLALFVFNGPAVRQLLEQALTNPAVWRADLAWRSCIADRPRLISDPPLNMSDMTLIYSWRN
jgi:hypothetical protein